MKIELWPCEYTASRSAPGCNATATTLVRPIDEQGRPLSQEELCDEHMEKKILASCNAKVHDRRRSVP